MSPMPSSRNPRQTWRLAALPLSLAVFAGAAVAFSPAPSDPPSAPPLPVNPTRPAPRSGGPGLPAGVVTQPQVSADGLKADAMWASRIEKFGGYEWVSRACRDSVMGFTVPMEIFEIKVVGGQHVKAGDLLVRGRDSEIIASIEAQRVRANNTAEVDSNQAQLDLGQLKFNQIESAFKQNAATQQEFDEKRLQLAAYKAALENAKEHLEEEKRKLTQLEKQAERYQIVAPFDGIVDLVGGETGQAVDVNNPFIRVVNIEKLWIDVPTPTAETLRLGLGEGKPAWVILDVPTESGADGVVKGKILYVSPVVDGSDSRRVRVEIDNPKALPAATKACVRFTPPSPSAMETTASATDAKPPAGGSR